MEIYDWLEKTLQMDKTTIRKFILSAPYRYKTYSILKRSGKGYRLISQPTPELKSMQKAVLNKYFSDLPIHQCAMAYRNGLSISSNANQHINNDFLLKMDFKDFFPSLMPKDLIDHIEKYKYSLSQNDKEVISRLFFFATKQNKQLRLSIGAPSSPFISNTLLYDFDTSLHEFLSDNNISYTRYADDLAFSTNLKGGLSQIPDQVRKLCRELSYPKLYINSEKTVFLSKSSNRHITGLTITNDSKLSIGRHRKRFIRAQINQFYYAQLNEGEILHLRGQLAFASGAEPTFIENLARKYGEQIIISIKRFQPGDKITNFSQNSPTSNHKPD